MSRSIWTRPECLRLVLLLGCAALVAEGHAADTAAAKPAAGASARPFVDRWVEMNINGTAMSAPVRMYVDVITVSVHY